MKKSCVIYDSWAELIGNLPDEMAGQLIKEVLGYAFGTNYETSGDPAISAMFAMIKMKLDEDSEAYQETIRQRSEAGKKGMSKRWNITNDNKVITNDNDVITNDNTDKQDITNITVSDSVSVYVSDKDKKKNIEKKFVKPTLDDVRAYCEERSNKVDPETFIDFYESKGWKVGNQGMKDWKACVRTWEKRGGPEKNTKIHDFHERKIDYSELEQFTIGGKL